ncbi:MAG TPA: heavy metal-associated domain-containing protein [Tepidisphaeraceae bacterium]|nr:heavy metal-associated domain-containing protein [Tepidisphaeraceae bacterium]
MASHGVDHDQLGLIKIQGMHCHKCEANIQKALSRLDGVHEVEVDFNSGLASVLFDPKRAAVEQLTASVTEAGYEVVGFNLASTNRTGR